MTLLFTGKGNEGGVRVVLAMANDFELSWFSFFNCDGPDCASGRLGAFDGPDRDLSSVWERSWMGRVFNCDGASDGPAIQ